MSTLQIRPFCPADYDAFVSAYNAVWSPPMPPRKTDSVRAEDGRRLPKYRFERYVGEVDGEVVAFAEVYEPWFFYAPGRWFVEMGVVPSARGQGFGRAMAAHLEAFLAQQETTILFAGAVEGSDGAMFAARAGYETKVREPLSELDVRTFDRASFGEHPLPEGVEIVDAKEVFARFPDAIPRWWDLGWEVQQDIPFNRESERMPLEVFAKRFEAPGFDPKLWFLAIHDGELVGLTGLKATGDPAVMLTTITGVRRSHRRQGLAMALKLRALVTAKAAGAQRICTDNEEDNPMLAINLRLGFVEVGAWLCLESGAESGAESAPGSRQENGPESGA